MPQVNGRQDAVLIVDANTGRVIHESSADDLRYPASLAKLMTLYLVFELIEQGRLTYQTKIRFSANAVAAQPSKLDVEEGDRDRAHRRHQGPDHQVVPTTWPLPSPSISPAARRASRS